MNESNTTTKTYRLSRRKFLAASSAIALAAACGPAATPGASGTASAAATAAATPGKPLKIGQLLPFTKVYAELGNSMKRATDLYLKQKGGSLANRPVTVTRLPRRSSRKARSAFPWASTSRP